VSIHISTGWYLGPVHVQEELNHSNLRVNDDCMFGH